MAPGQKLGPAMGIEGGGLESYFEGASEERT